MHSEHVNREPDVSLINRQGLGKRRLGQDEDGVNEVQFAAMQWMDKWMNGILN